MPDKQGSPFEKIMPSALHPKETWQLRHGNRQSGPSLEAHEDAVANQFHEHAKSKGPGNQAKQGHGEARQAGNLSVALSIAARHRPHCSGDHE